ncbi:MAG: APC family permease [Solirubrobacterales bacterium]|nr:APC family permease [Solirubrobacterales bacterium]
MDEKPAENGHHLERTLTLWPIVLFGIAYITPFIVLTTFGVFSEVANGTLASAYAITTVAMIFTAVSYGKMARLFPNAGSAYTYSRGAIGDRVGFMVGWAVLLDYFFLPMVVWLIGTAYLTDQFPAIPGWVFLLAFIILTTGLNIIGIRVATRVNIALISFQVLVLLFFLGFSLGHVIGDDGIGGVLSVEPFWNSASTISAISAGAAITAYSFIGFDAVSTFAEEAKNPRKTIPRAIILTAGIAGVIFVIVAYVVQLVHPGGVFENADSAPLDIAKMIAGDFFGSIFLATVIVAQFTAGVPIQAAGARLMYAMGRDEALPKRIFAYVSDHFHTPIINLLLTGAIGLLALGLTVSSSTSFINFGAFTAFAAVNISVIAYYLRHREEKQLNPLSWILQPLIGLAVIIWLMTHLDSHALILGGCWLVVGLIWLAFLTKGFSKPPPEMHMAEDEIEEPDKSAAPA